MRICGNLFMCSSTNTPRTLVCLTWSILLPSMSIDASSVLYILLLGVNIMKLVSFVFSESFFVMILACNFGTVQDCHICKGNDFIAILN